MTTRDSFTPSAPDGLPPVGAGQVPAQPEQLLDALPWGVLVLAADGTVSYLSAAVAALWGVAAPAVVGQRPAEVQPAVLPPALVQVLRQPVAEPAAYWLPHTRQWVKVRATPAPEGQHWVFWEPMAAAPARELEAQAAFLLRLQDALASLAEAGAMLRTATRLLGERVGVTGVLYGELTAAAAHVLAAHSYYRPNGHPEADRYQPDDLAPALAEQLRAGQLVVIPDVAAAPSLPEAARAACAARGVRAVAAVPLLHQQGSGAAFLCLQHHQPREWTTAELQLLTETAERTGAAVERARANEATRASEAKYRLLFESTDQGFYLAEALFDTNGQCVDILYHDENPAAVRMTGHSFRGHRLSEMDGYEPYWLEIFGRTARTGQAQRLERYAAPDGIWYDFYVFKPAQAQDNGIGVVFSDITERRRVQEALRESEAKYRAIFNSINEGFSLLEVQFDAEGNAYDVIIRDANPAQDRIDGVRALIGQRFREILPNTEVKWIERYGRVAQTGEHAQFEDWSEATQRWYEVDASRVGGPGSTLVAIVYNDITARKQDVARQAFRLALSQALTTATDPVEVQEVVTRTTMQYFGADRCYYCEVYDGQAIIRHDAAQEGLPSVAGVYPLVNFPLLQAVIEAGQPFIVPDVRTAEDVDEELRQLCVALQVIAYVDVPVVRKGKVVGVLCLVQSTPRAWNAGDVELATETAERTWAAVERARAEEALRKSEGQLRTLVVNLPGAAVFVVDADLRYQLAEGEALATAGFTPADLVGRTVAEAMPPELVATYEADYRQALAGQSFSVEQAAHGHVYLSRGVPLPGPTGLPEAVLVVSYDITERKQIEEALAASEVKYRTLFETMDQGFGIGQVLPADEAAGKPLDWQWLEVNPPFERLTGLARADVLTYTMRELVPGLEEIWYERYGHVAATGETVSFESYSPVLSSWFDVYVFALGTPATRRVAVLFTNTTERKRAEEVLRQAEARYREQLEQQVATRTRELRESRDLLQSVFDTSLVAMSVMQAVRNEAGEVVDFRLQAVNRELERQTGRTDLVGRHYLQEYPGVVEVGIYDLLLRVLATGQPQGMEYYYDHEGFDRWFSCQFVQLGDGVVATNLDITERKQAEEELRQNLQLLEQSEEVAQLGSWVYELATGELRWSRGLYRLMHLEPGTPVQPTRYLDYAVAEDRPVAARVVQALTAAPTDFEETLRLHVGGEVRALRIKAVLLRNAAGQPVRLLGMNLDVSRVLQLEADNLRLRLRRQQELFEAVLTAQENERQRIAEGLHNGVGQTLYATKLQFAHTQSMLPGATWQRVDQLLADAIRQTRAISHELVPMVLHEFGLGPALTDICRTLNSSQLDFTCDVDLTELTQPLPALLQLAVYRIAQELAQNIIKHAHATEATLTLEAVPGFLLLRAEDNGVGFPPNADARMGLGLRSIRDRVALLGGTMNLGSTPQAGTYVRLRLPLPPDQEPA